MRLFLTQVVDGHLVAQLIQDLLEGRTLRFQSAKKVSVNATSYLLGFSEPAAFSRAFKRWAGSSPRRTRLKD